NGVTSSPRRRRGRSKSRAGGPADDSPADDGRPPGRCLRRRHGCLARGTRGRGPHANAVSVGALRGAGSTCRAHAIESQPSKVIAASDRGTAPTPSRGTAGRMKPLAADDIVWDPSGVVSAFPVVAVPAETLPFTTAAAIALAQPVTPEWFVHGFAAPGVVTEVVGKLKASGKTTFVSWMVLALLLAGEFLGRVTRRTPVVWLTEERPQSFLETLKRAGLTDRTDLHILHWHDVKAMSWPDVMRGAIAHAHSIGAGVLVVDTVSQFAGL